MDEVGGSAAVSRRCRCLLADLRGGAQAADTHAQSSLLMDLLSNLALGFEVAFSPVNLFYCFVGVFLGTFIGVLPGIGALAAVSMLLPVTFYLEPATALVMLAEIGRAHV